MRAWITRTLDSLDRRHDRPARRPGDLRHGPGDRPPLPQSLTLALQHLSLQASYWVLPLIVARSFGLDAAQGASFLSLSLLCVAAATLAQSWASGPLGSGYPVPMVPTPVTLPVYLGAATAGLGLGAASTATALACLGVATLVVLLPRALRLLSTETSGVVIFGVGLGFVPMALATLRPLLDGLPAGEPIQVPGLGAMQPERLDLAVFASSLIALVSFGLIRWRLAPYGLIVAMIGGTAMTLATTGLDAEARQVLQDAPWFALPMFVTPEFEDLDTPLLLAACVAVLSMTAGQLGDLIAVQREQDADWSRPDLTPLRRGLATHGLAVALGSMSGAMPSNPSSAGIALSIATRSFSRRVIRLCAVLVAGIALCPKLVALLLTVPEPVIAALLVFLGGWLMCAGVRLITVRMMDARRTSCVGLALFAALATVVAPDLLRRMLPAALASPVTVSFLVAFGLHLATLPLVRRSAAATLRLDRDAGRSIDAFVEQAAGAWGLRRATADAVAHALVEIGDLLAARGVPGMQVRARAMDGRVRVEIEHPLPVLSEPSERPDASDLEDERAAEAFAMWMATRLAGDVRLSASREHGVVQMTFID